MDLILTALNASVSLIIAITALFAMNFHMTPGDGWQGQVRGRAQGGFSRPALLWGTEAVQRAGPNTRWPRESS